MAIITWAYSVACGHHNLDCINHNIPLVLPLLLLLTMYVSKGLILNFTTLGVVGMSASCTQMAVVSIVSHQPTELRCPALINHLLDLINQS